MKILITNDDGYDHPGHTILKKILRGLAHEVWSIAPRHNQSGVGMKLSLGRDVQFQRAGEYEWICSGTPVDCVSFALHGLLPFPIDAVVSGINAGANLSDDLWYSGTAAAAREAGKWQIPALALSYSYSSTPPYRHQGFSEQDFSSFAYLLEQHFDDLLQSCELRDQNCDAFMGFLNINIPKNCNGQVLFADRFERRPYQNQLQKCCEDSYMLAGRLDAEYPLSAGVDAAADISGMASISLTSFHALQPLPSALVLAPSPAAKCAAKRIVQAGIAGLQTR